MEVQWLVAACGKQKCNFLLCLIWQSERRRRREPVVHIARMAPSSPTPMWSLLQTGEQWEGASPARTRKNFNRLRIQHHFYRSCYVAQEGPVRSSDTKPLNIIFPQCNWSNETPRVRWACATLAWKYQSCCCLGTVPGLKGVVRVSQQRYRARSAAEGQSPESSRRKPSANGVVRSSTAPTECLKVLSFPKCPCGKAGWFCTGDQEWWANTHPWAAAGVRDGAQAEAAALVPHHWLCAGKAVCPALASPEHPRAGWEWQGATSHPCSSAIRPRGHPQVHPSALKGSIRTGCGVTRGVGEVDVLLMSQSCVAGTGHRGFPDTRVFSHKQPWKTK